MAAVKVKTKDDEPTSLREAREMLGLTLAEVASKAECSVGHLSDVERGKANGSPHLAFVLAPILKIQRRLARQFVRAA